MKKSIEAIKRQRIARNKRKRAEKRQLKKNIVEELMQEKGKRLATEEKLLSTEKNKQKFYQMWRQTEREKEKLFQSQMTMDKKCVSLENGVPSISLLEIPREMISLEGDSKDAILGEGKFGKVKLASYRGLSVAVKQFGDGISRAEIEHEANIMSSFNHLNLPVLFGISCQEKPYLLVLQFYGVAGKAISLKDCFQPSSVPLNIKTSNWLNVVVHLSDGLRYIHDKHILHNDIKADNIVMVKEECGDIFYSPILVDFGKAKYMSQVRKKKLTETDKEIYRKKHFHIAPEIIAGSHAPSVKSDVYSMGLVFCKVYKLLKDKNLKDLCKKCLAQYNYRCTSKELRDMAGIFQASNA